MHTRSVMDDDEAANLMAYLRNTPMPFTITVTPGKKRSTDQNRLQRLWINEIAEQRGDITPEEVRGQCKLEIGVPILRAENEVFAEEYDRLIKPLPYETKLGLMMEPFDFGVTRIMTAKQKTKYLDQLHKTWVERGIILTDPEAR